VTTNLVIEVDQAMAIREKGAEVAESGDVVAFERALEQEADLIARVVIEVPLELGNAVALVKKNSPLRSILSKLNLRFLSLRLTLYRCT